MAHTCTTHPGSGARASTECVCASSHSLSSCALQLPGGHGPLTPRTCLAQHLTGARPVTPSARKPSHSHPFRKHTASRLFASSPASDVLCTMNAHAWDSATCYCNQRYYVSGPSQLVANHEERPAKQLKVPSQSLHYMLCAGNLGAGPAQPVCSEGRPVCMP